MTDWRIAYSDYNNKPAVIDTTMSPTTVYIRKDIEEIDVTDPMNEGETHKQWKYLERTCTHEEYAVAQLSSEMIQLKHDTEVIDSYTTSLIEEGLL